MTSLNIIKARKILGKSSRDISDKEILHDIEIATMFKELFFEITSSQGQYNKLCNNHLNVNKTTSGNLH